MRFALIALAFALAACAQEPAPPADPVAEVIAAERAFAADAARRGWVEAFLTHAAPDGIVLQNGPQNAIAFFTNIDPGNLNDTTLAWSPMFAGASAAGDLGFTTGPFNGGDTAFGYFFTVWERQPDGSLKWIYDGGIDTQTPLEVAPDGPVARMAMAAANEGSAEAARAAVAAAEVDLAAQAASDVRAAFAEHVAENVRLYRKNAAPAETAIAADALLAQGPATLQFRQTRAEASAAGDLVFTIGEARWTGEAGANEGYYTRIWTREADGWRLAFDQILVQALPAAE